MKHLKSVISLLVALCIVAAMTVTAFATEDTSSLDESSSELVSSETEVVGEVQSQLNNNKIVKFDKFDTDNFSGDTDKIGSNGLLYANGKEINTLVLNETLDLGKTWQVTATFTRKNTATAAKNCLGEKYELSVGDVTLKVGNQQSGVDQYVAELWYQTEKIGYVQLNSDFSGTYAIRFTQDGTQVGKLYVTKDNTTMSWNVVDSTLVSVDSVNGVASYYNIPGDPDFSNAEISVTAAGNNSTDKTNYAYGLWIAKKFYSTNRTGDGSTGNTGTGSGSGSGNSGKTGDARPIVFVLVALVAAGACIVLTAKKSCKE